MTHVVQGEVGPVIPVSDIATARAFYEGRLGLRGSETPGGGYRLDAGGATRVYLLELPQDAGRATWPVASFQVTDVDAAVKELTEAGPRPVGNHRAAGLTGS
jgi:catechol 2,3-dioxygenase-like lactoylglutathione lyase family enzyme